MAFGFAQPFMSRLGPIAQRAAAAMPQAAPMKPPDPMVYAPTPKFPALPQEQAKPAEAAPQATPAPTMPSTPPAEGRPAEADGIDVGDLLAAIFGG